MIVLVLLATALIFIIRRRAPYISRAPYNNRASNISRAPFIGRVQLQKRQEILNGSAQNVELEIEPVMDKISTPTAESAKEPALH